MAVQDVYERRWEFQRELDQLFPEGVWLQTLDLGGNAEGPDMAVGRLFCSDASLQEDGTWFYEVFADERAQDDEGADYTYDKPYRFWVSSIDEAELEYDNIYESLLVFPQDAVEQGLIVRYEDSPPSREKRPPRGHREFTTERWYSFFFPREVADE